MQIKRNCQLTRTPSPLCRLLSHRAVDFLFHLKMVNEIRGERDERDTLQARERDKRRQRRREAKGNWVFFTALLLLLEAIWKENITGNEGKRFSHKNARIMRAGDWKKIELHIWLALFSSLIFFLFLFFFICCFIFIFCAFVVVMLGLILLHYMADEKEELHEWFNTIYKPSKPLPPPPSNRLGLGSIYRWHCYCGMDSAIGIEAERGERKRTYIYIYNEWKCCWWHPIYINMPVNRRIARRGEGRWNILAGLCDREVWGVGCDWTKKRGKNSPGSSVSVCSYAVGRWPLCCNWNQLGWHSVS